jgi:hypothetical protein
VSRRLVGRLAMVVGGVHVVIAPVLFPESMRSILDGGVVNAVEADATLAQLRGLGFWYVTAGLGLLVTGAVVDDLERRDVPLPRAVALGLGGIGVWGVVLMPTSPFWAIIGLGLLAARARRPTP